MARYIVGDTVTILRKDIAPLAHRKYPVRGTVARVNGAYIAVRPHHCKWVAELYQNEVDAV